MLFGHTFVFGNIGHRRKKNHLKTNNLKTKNVKIFLKPRFFQPWP